MSVETGSLRRFPVLRIGLAVALLGSGGVVGGKILFDKLSESKAGTTEQQPGGIMPSQDAFDRLVTVTATSTPPPTEVPSPTATAERKPEKNPLQTYAAYASEKNNSTSGVFDPKTGNKVGGIVIASLPNTGAQLDNIFGYLVIQLPQNTRTFYAFLAQIERVEGATFVAQSRSRQGIWDLEITQDGTKISGKVTRKSKDGGPVTNEYKFQAGLYGSQTCSTRDATRFMKGQEYRLGQPGNTDEDLFLLYGISLPCAAC